MRSQDPQVFASAATVFFAAFSDFQTSPISPFLISERTVVRTGDPCEMCAMPSLRCLICRAGTTSSHSVMPSAEGLFHLHITVSFRSCHQHLMVPSHPSRTDDGQIEFRGFQHLVKIGKRRKQRPFIPERPLVSPHPDQRRPRFPRWAVW
jgi:hypothetical protein